ncbi:Chaperone protein DnaK [Trichinella spiralis]
MGKEEACATVLLWLLICFKFIFNCIYFFATHYGLPEGVEPEDLWALLVNGVDIRGRCKPKRRQKWRKKSRKVVDDASRDEVEEGSVVLASPEAAESYVAEQRLQLQAGKLQRIAVLTVPSQLPLLYSSPRAPGISETNYITCIFESTAAKVVEVVDDIRHELSRWISINDMVTVCCELSWSVPVDQRDVNCEKEVKQALLKHMRANQDRVASMTAALYHAKGWLKAVPDKTPVSNIQEQCRTVGGTVNGCYRRIYDTLIPLVHSQARDMHQSYWALTMDRPLQPHVPTTPNRSVYALNLICITVERSDHFTLLSS